MPTLAELQTAATAALARADHKAALAIYMQALELAPSSAPLYANIASTHFNLGNIPAAKEALTHVNGSMLRSPDYLNLCGLIAQKEGDFTAAEAAYQKALKADPKYVEALGNLASLYIEQQKLDKALPFVERALRFEPTHADLLCLRGNIHYRQGEFEQALVLYKQVLAHRTGHVVASRQLFLCASYLYAAHDMAPFIQQLNLAAQPPFKQATVAVGLMITHWLRGEAAACADAKNGLEMVLPVLAKHPDLADETDKTNFKVMFAFLNMFKALSATLPPARVPNMPLIYAVGDSHTLPMHGQKISINNTEYQVQSQLITGCKAWDIISPTPNECKGGLRYWLQKVPAGAPVIISIGEIDLRPDYGIWPYAKSKNISPTQHAQITAAGFITALAGMNAHNADMYLTIPAAPTPKSMLDIPQPEHAAFIEMYKTFCETIRTHAPQKQIKIIDIYTYTANPHGMAKDENLYLDGRHLKPEVLELVVGN